MTRHSYGRNRPRPRMADKLPNRTPVADPNGGPGGDPTSSTPGTECASNNRLLIVCLLLLAPAVSCTVLLGLSRLVGGKRLSAQEYWALGAPIFLAWWWVVYFASPSISRICAERRRPALCVWTLRLFLDSANPYRANSGSMRNSEFSQEDLRGTVQSTVTFLGFAMGIVALFLNLVMGNSRLPVTHYQSIVRSTLLIVGLFTVLLFVLAVDIMDTLKNTFAVGERQLLEYRRFFFRRVGPPAPKGGISYTYYGIAGLTIVVVLAIAYFSPLSAGYGVSFYMYLAYPPLFGYRGVHSNKAGTPGAYETQVDTDVGAGLLGVGLGGFMAAATLLASYL